MEGLSASWSPDAVGEQIEGSKIQKILDIAAATFRILY
jgi:hypothetical protein